MLLFSTSRAIGSSGLCHSSTKLFTCYLFLQLLLLLTFPTVLGADDGAAARQDTENSLSERPLPIDVQRLPAGHSIYVVPANAPALSLEKPAEDTGQKRPTKKSSDEERIECMRRKVSLRSLLLIQNLSPHKAHSA
jgi:hypothetical protein